MSKKESVNQCVCVCYLHAGWSSAGRWWRTFSQRNTGDVQLLLFPAEQRMWQELTRLNYWPILSSIFTRHHGHTLCQFLLRRKGYCKARRQNSAPPCDLVWYNFPFKVFESQSHFVYFVCPVFIKQANCYLRSRWRRQCRRHTSVIPAVRRLYNVHFLCSQPLPDSIWTGVRRSPSACFFLPETDLWKAKPCLHTPPGVDTCCVSIQMPFVVTGFYKEHLTPAHREIHFTTSVCSQETGGRGWGGRPGGAVPAALMPLRPRW